MAKPVIRVGLALATDHVFPMQGQVLNISAVHGNYKFTQNIQPARGRYRTSRFWEKYPTEFELLKKNAVPVEEAMARFHKWLANFQGAHVAVTQGSDFFHLLNLYNQIGEDN